MFTRRSFLALLGIAPAAAAIEVPVQPARPPRGLFVVPQNPVMPMPPLSIGLGDYLPAKFEIPQRVRETLIQVYGLEARGVQ